LLLDDNNIDSIPCFSFLNNLDTLHVQGNEVTFDDILCNSAASDYVFCPQDSIGERLLVDLAPGDDYIIELSIDDNIVMNQYQWFKDGVLLSATSVNQLELIDVNMDDVGVYNCLVTNSAASCLELNSRDVSITVMQTGLFDQPAYLEHLTVSPVPFIDKLTVDFTLNEMRHLSMKLIDITGREAHVFDERTQFEPGAYSIVLDVPQVISNGIYFFTVSSEDERISVILVKN
jgi:hypothetical protein